MREQCLLTAIMRIKCTNSIKAFIHKSDVVLKSVCEYYQKRDQSVVLHSFSVLYSQIKLSKVSISKNVTHKSSSLIKSVIKLCFHKFFSLIFINIAK